MLDFLTSSSNMVYLSVDGSTPQAVLEDLLNKLIQENLENITIEKQEKESYKVVNNTVNQVSERRYNLQYKTTSLPPILSPDII
jgi:hypothetical protein